MIKDRILAKYYLGGSAVLHNCVVNVEHLLGVLVSLHRVLEGFSQELVIMGQLKI
jgi:hypothetical protein